MIRVLIAAASPVVRAGLEALLASSPGLELAGSYPDLAAVEELHPDVAIAALPFDDLPPPQNGAWPAIVWLAAGDDPAFTQAAFRLGVRAVLPRDASSAGVLAAVEAAAAGLAVLDPRTLAPLLPAAPARENATLTPRELEVLRMMAEGDANKNIAWRLGISEHTAKFHVASILSKLNAGTRTEAVTIGVRKGLVLI
jgi:DNA-binding NarL/FixJ family response regulator